MVHLEGIEAPVATRRTCLGSDTLTPSITPRVPAELHVRLAVHLPDRRTAIAEELTTRSLLDGEQPEAVALVAPSRAVDPRHDALAIDRDQAVGGREPLDAARVRRVDCPEAAPLTVRDSVDLVRLYQESYPGNWFDLRALETGQYFGLRQDGRIVSVAGVHVYSERYAVAALGNIVTHPAYRRRGYARQVTARLCQSVLRKVEYVGLNVKADNEAAVGCYTGLGFGIVAPYGEFTFTARL